MNRCRCANCGGAFERRPQNPDQTYCSKRECQRARKRLWQKAKMKSDADYRENQRRAQKQWREKNPDYWQQWRSAHPDYVERNRARQRTRNKKRDKRTGIPEGDASIFAKMDASMPGVPFLSGTYRLVPADCKDGHVSSGFLCEISRLSEREDAFP